VAGSSLSPLRERFEQALDRLSLPPGRVLVAVSGGPDSVALLDLFATTSSHRGFDLRVVHFDHGIDPSSGTVAEQVRSLAGRYRLPFELGTAKLGRGTSETRARQARLGWFRALLAEHRPAVLATGHHADDQVETVLMRFLRGSGPAGLAGIAERRGPFIRPLLAISRAELAAHVDQIGIRPWIDPANADHRHLRSWVRTRVVPELESRIPQLRQNLLVASKTFASDRDAWDSLAKELPQIDFRDEGGAVSVAAPPLGGYSSAVVRSTLRAVGRQGGVGLSERSLDRLQDLLAHGDTGQSVDLVSGVRAELAFGRLRLFRRAEHLTGGLLIDSEAGRAELGPWLVTWECRAAPERLERVAFETWVDDRSPIEMRPWRPGDQIRPLRGRGARLVVRCMQDTKVPRSRRSDWLVAESGGTVVWVPGVCRGEALVPAPGTRGRRIDVRPS
jgi:tRNA(Ile)-lysidine synthase